MKRGFFGQKGNVFAFLAMAIILLAFMLLLARHEPLQMPKDSNTESKVETAVQENITRTVRQTTQNFATSGYSKQSSAWVCNAFQPPVANEVDSNFRWMLYNDINNILFPVMQKELGYEFSPDFDVKLGISQEGDIQAQLNKVLSLDGTKVDMNVSFITVKTAGKNEERKLSNSYFISFPYRKWLMYKKYVEWGQAHLDELGPQVCNELTNAHQCVFNACGDHDKEILITDDYINGQIDLSKLDIEKYVQKQLDYLNSITKPENIECEIPIVTKPDGTTKLDISMATEIVIARMQKCSTCDKPKFASTNMPGCAAMEPSDLGCDVRDKLGPWLLEPGYPPTVKETVQCNDDMNKQEAVAANSNLAFSFQFICKDKTRSIPFDAGVEESTSKISVVARITRTCPVAFFDWEDGSNPNPDPPPNPPTAPPRPPTTPPQPPPTPPPTPPPHPPKTTQTRRNQPSISFSCL
ncbi:MAG: hypothetical protein NT067_01115 [Candidatus Diapherotrites archaeon]|nr:hypothetical protein [Candidatus Diapherotrites archaeon]